MATVHQPHTPSHGVIAKFMLRFAARFCSPFLAVSQNAENSWFGSSQLIQPNVSIHAQAKHLTFYNMVDVAAIERIAAEVDTAQERKKNGLQGKTVIGAVSRLRHEKGIDLLLTAFAGLLEENKNIHLLLVGDGPDRKQYEAMVQEKKMGTHVTFYGAAQWEKAIALMQLMDIVVVPSRFEGFGLTAAEAMALAKPIIAADNFGLRELVTHQQEGLLFTNADSSALQEAIQTALNHPDEAHLWGQGAKTKVQRLFDRPIFERNVKALYQL